jgi:hypothetical protein
MKISDIVLTNIPKLALPSLLYSILYHPVVNIFVYVHVRYVIAPFLSCSLVNSHNTGCCHVTSVEGFLGCGGMYQVVVACQNGILETSGHTTRTTNDVNLCRL